MTITLIIPTYNWPQALQLSLESLIYQTNTHFEVIIVDDGSTDETRKMIEDFKTNRANFPITHLWQEDQGFRLAKARNMGIQHAKGEYIVFLDGDCILRPTFIEHHHQLAEERYLVFGHRILLSEKYKNLIMQAQEIQNNFNLSQQSFFQWLKHAFKHNINRWHPLINLPAKHRWRYRTPKKWQKVRGCNFACWKKDLLTAKGFDESISGWGYEDSDIAIRLLNAGVRFKSGHYMTAVFHLWHPENDRSNEKENHNFLMKTLNSGRVEAVQSIIQSSFS